MRGTAFVLDQVLWLMIIVIIARAVISWVNADPYNPLVRFISALADPFCATIRRYIPSVYGGIDLSPMIAILLIGFLRIVLVQNLYQYAVVVVGNF